MLLGLDCRFHLNGPKLIRRVQGCLNFHWCILQILICARFVPTFECVLACLRLLLRREVILCVAYASPQSFAPPDPCLFEPNSFVTLHNLVYASGQPNFLGARLPVPTSLNLSLWRSLLTEYSDVVVCDYLEFGWPIGYDYHGVLPSSDFRNHKGALDFPSAVDSYLSSELTFDSVCGPFARNPFEAPIALSPLNSVPKLFMETRPLGKS